MTERRVYPNLSSIGKLLGAESARISGDYAEASSLLPAIPTLEGKNRLIASRVLVASHVGQAKASEQPDVAGYHLGEARKVIVKEYSRGRPDRIATGLDEFVHDTPNDLLADEAKYLLTLAALTGNSEILDAAQNRMNTVIETTKDNALRAATVFDMQRLRYKDGENSVKYEKVKAAFSDIATDTYQHDRPELVAVAASRYLLTAQDREDFREVERGLVIFENTVNQDQRLRHHLIDEVTSEHNAKEWGKHTADENYVALSLPPRS